MKHVEDLTIELYRLNLTTEILIKAMIEKGLFTEDEFFEFYGDCLKKSDIDEEVKVFKERVFE